MLGTAFDSLARPLAPKDQHRVTVSGATSEAAEAKGPLRFREQLGLPLGSFLSGLGRILSCDLVEALLRRDH
jgi:hypothetical protein